MDIGTNHGLSIISRGLIELARELVATESLAPTVRLPLAPPFSNMSRENWLRALDLWLTRGTDLIECQPTRSCPACGGQRTRSLFTSYDGYRFADCLTCGTWFVPVLV